MQETGISTEAHSIAAGMQTRKWKFFTPEQAQGFLDDPSELDHFDVSPEYIECFFAEFEKTLDL